MNTIQQMIKAIKELQKQVSELQENYRESNQIHIGSNFVENEKKISESTPDLTTVTETPRRGRPRKEDKE
jgi:uncharacterized protein YoxC